MPRRPVRLQLGIEEWLEAERDTLILWLPVSFGGGIAAWFVLPDPASWTAMLLLCVATALAGIALAGDGRAGRVVAIGGLAAAAGLASIWWRAERVGAPILARPAVVAVQGKVEQVEPLPARDLIRLTLRSDGAGVPPRVRINLPIGDAPDGLGEGAVIGLRARLMPPADAAVPGGYDFARVAWFAGIGATGRGFAPVRVIRRAAGEGLRAGLTSHILSRLPGSRGGIAAALATGDEGAITLADADAMRRAGLAHLLSVSGLHITAAVGATMLLVMRLLALSPWLAIRWRLPLVAAAARALAAIGYTWLTGSQVPTIRSCVAALLVLAALVLGREAMTLRLVAGGAIAVMLVWPEAVTGPSFQLSFTAIAAIVTLHDHPRVAGWFRQRDEPWRRRILREGAALLLTGVVVEAALMPIAVFHFHKAGLYGAAANIVAIPLTTFVVMPLEAAALLADTVGLGPPVWWLTDLALRLLLVIAHRVAALPGSGIALPAMSAAAFALIVGGGLWLMLWRTRVRHWGLLPILLGGWWMMQAPAPDLLVTGDGRHMAVRVDGRLALLRERAGDYTRAMLAENGGIDGEPLPLSGQAAARCSADACIVTLRSTERAWRIVATRSAYPVDRAALIGACHAADIVVSERRLPRSCRPRWLRLDAPLLRRTGGIAIDLESRRVRTVLQPGDRHPWRIARLSRSGAGCPTICPARGRARGRSAAVRRRGWRDRAGPSRPRGGNI